MSSFGKIIGLISIKGGVGKTTSAINLANLLANNFGKKVLIVDGNFSAPSLALQLGIENVPLGVHEVLKNEIMVKDAVYEHNLGFFIMPASFKKEKINPMGLRSKLQSLRRDFDYILIDSSPTLSDEMLSVMMASDEIFVVTTPDHVTLSNTLHAVKIAMKNGVPITGLILNKVKGKKYELTSKQITKIVGVPVLGAVSEKINVLDALSKNIPVSSLYQLSNVSISYGKICEYICGERFKKPNFLLRFFNYFKEELIDFKNHDFSKRGRYYK